MLIYIVKELFFFRDIQLTQNLNLPNIISSCRLASAPVMLALIAAGRMHAFTWLLLAALVSDFADGVIARAWHLETRLGAKLDAMADMATYLSAVVGLFVFKLDFLQAYWMQMAAVFGFYVLEKINSFVRYKKVFNTFHTYLSKATAYAQGAFVLSLFLFGFKWYLFYPAMALCIAANIEEIIIARMLTSYESDVKGLYWVLRRRKEKA